MLRLFIFALLAGILLSGCTPQPKPSPDGKVTVAPGITFQRDENAGFQILDVDLQTARVKPVVAASNVKRIRNNFVGDAKTVREWAEENHAVAGINANFFGVTYDTVGRRKQIVGLAVVDGQVVAPGDMAESHKLPKTRRVRSAFGVSGNGVPDIAWATGSVRGVPRAYPAPIDPDTSDVWRVRFAAACGPRLFANGVLHIGDRDEWLVDPKRVSRAFVAYDVVGNKPRHIIIGRADVTDYAGITQYLQSYFSRVHQSVPHEAMCFDGGPSAQIVYRNGENGALEDVEATGVLVPTALLFVPK